MYHDVVVVAVVERAFCKDHYREKTVVENLAADVADVVQGLCGMSVSGMEIWLSASSCILAPTAIISSAGSLDVLGDTPDFPCAVLRLLAIFLVFVLDDTKMFIFCLAGE